MYHSLIEQLAGSSLLLSPTMEERVCFKGERKSNTNSICQSVRHGQYPLPPSRPRRAALALILRSALCSSPSSYLNDLSSNHHILQQGEEGRDDQVLLIRRAINPRDKWSGHVALPGGRQEFGETDLQTAVRECREEVGIELSSRQFNLLGRLPDRKISNSKNKLAVSCFVFVCTDPVELSLKVQEAEVAHAWWVGAGLFFPEHKNQHIGLSVSTMLPAASLLRMVLLLLRLRTLYFPCFYLPLPPGVTPPPLAQDKGGESGNVANIVPRGSEAGFVLWGFTFGVISDMVVAAGGVPFAQPPPYFKFCNPVADFLLRAYYCSIRAATLMVKKMMGYKG